MPVCTKPSGLTAFLVAMEFGGNFLLDFKVHAPCLSSQALFGICFQTLFFLRVLLWPSVQPLLRTRVFWLKLCQFFIWLLFWDWTVLVGTVPVGTTMAFNLTPFWNQSVPVGNVPVGTALAFDPIPFWNWTVSCEKCAGLWSNFCLESNCSCCNCSSLWSVPFWNWTNPTGTALAFGPILLELGYSTGTVLAFGPIPSGMRL